MKILNSLTVLYAEDDQVIKESIARVLEIFFDEVIVAKDGMEALKMFQSKSINVVILDYMMPFLDGYEVAKEIRKINKNIPIIMASAYTDKEKLLKVMDLQLVKYLEKPILKEDLLKVLKETVQYLVEYNLLTTQLDQQTSYCYITKTVTNRENETIQLSKKEIIFLELLLSNPGFLITKEVIEERVFEEDVEQNTLRNMVYRLRKKINCETIVTVKDLGYLLSI